jgi:hypothetical protein
MSKKLRSPLPSEQQILKDLIERIEQVANLLDKTPTTLCRLILKDNRLFDQTRLRYRYLRDGRNPDNDPDAKRSVSLKTYDLIRTSLDKMEAKALKEAA